MGSARPDVAPHGPLRATTCHLCVSYVLSVWRSSPLYRLQPQRPEKLPGVWLGSLTVTPSPYWIHHARQSRCGWLKLTHRRKRRHSDNGRNSLSATCATENPHESPSPGNTGIAVLAASGVRTSTPVTYRCAEAWLGSTTSTLRIRRSTHYRMRPDKLGMVFGPILHLYDRGNGARLRGRIPQHQFDDISAEFGFHLHLLLHALVKVRA